MVQRAVSCPSLHTGWFDSHASPMPAIILHHAARWAATHLRLCLRMLLTPRCADLPCITSCPIYRASPHPSAQLLHLDTSTCADLPCMNPRPTQSITPPLTAACCGAGRRERSHSSQGQVEEQALPPEDDLLNVPQPSPAPLMQDPPDLNMDEPPPMGAGLLGDNLEGLDAMLPSPTPSGKSGSRSAGRSRCGGRTSGSEHVGSDTFAWC